MSRITLTLRAAASMRHCGRVSQTHGCRSTLLGWSAASIRWLRAVLSLLAIGVCVALTACAGTVAPSSSPGTIVPASTPPEARSAAPAPPTVPPEHSGLSNLADPKPLGTVVSIID